MMFAFRPIKLNVELAESECRQPAFLSREERAALKQADAAERAFRASKGYEPDTFFYRMRKKHLKRREK